MELRGKLTGHHEQLHELAGESERALQRLVNTSHEQRESQISITQADRQKIISESHTERVSRIETAERSRADRAAAAVSSGRAKIEEVRSYVGGNPQIMHPIDSWFAERRRLVNSREQEKRQTISSIEKAKQEQIVNVEQSTRQTIKSKQDAYRNAVAPHDVRQHSLNWIIEKIDTYQRLMADTHQTSTSSLLVRVSNAGNELTSRLDTASRELDERLRIFVTELEERLRIARIRHNEQEAVRRQRADQNTSGKQQPQGNRQQSSTKSEIPRQPQNEDPRLSRLAGKETGIDLYPHKVFLANLDHQRHKGRSDEEIYKFLMRHFHPDRSEHKHSAEITRILNAAYDKQDKKFRF